MMNTTAEADAFRNLDVVLSVLLLIGLCERFWVRSKPSAISGPISERIAMRVALTSWTLLTISSMSADFIRHGTAADASLPIRVVGHGIGVVYCAVAWSIDRDRKKRPRPDDKRIF
jgi:hypothetical protein